MPTVKWRFLRKQDLLCFDAASRVSLLAERDFRGSEPGAGHRGPTADGHRLHTAAVRLGEMRPLGLRAVSLFIETRSRCVVVAGMESPADVFELPS
jgi:hypothetical protein